MKERPTNADVEIVEKTVKHTYTVDERDNLGGDLAQAFAALRGIESEFEQVKSGYKSRTAEQEARIDKLSTNRMNGFEMRVTRCRVEFRPKEGRKYYFAEDAPDDAAPLLDEPMTQDDYNRDLIRAEAKFEARRAIPLFETTNMKRNINGEMDSGCLIVGRFNGKWFSALRLRIGKHTLEERLDSEQPCCKKRSDAINRAAKRIHSWLVENIGKDAAKGFEEPITKALEPERELEE